MKHSRPKNLNLLTIRFPLPAITSILHRISGFVLFLAIPLMIWLLDFSLHAEGFSNLQAWSQSIWMKLLYWLLLAPLCYHLVAGCRHLLSDLHVGNSRQGGKQAALLTLIISTVLIIWIGIWLW